MIKISDILWNEIKNVIPERNKVGRPQKDSRTVLNGILFVVVTGIQWKYLPREYGASTTIHGRFRIWVKTGIFSKLLNLSIDKAISKLGSAECFLVDASTCKAPLAIFGGKNPTDRSKNGVKKSLVIDYNRVILSIIIDAANRHDSNFFIKHVDQIKKFVGSKSKVIISDSAYDIKKLYKYSTKNNLALLASTNIRRDKNKIKFIPKGRWRIEQIFGIQQWKRGIKFCWTKTLESFLAYCQFISAVHNFKLIGVFG